MASSIDSFLFLFKIDIWQYSSILNNRLGPNTFSLRHVESVCLKKEGIFFFDINFLSLRSPTLPKICATKI